MLQQTTVVAVMPYYERFLARFPTVQDLAAADENEVFGLWEGLGYYSRARNLRRAAQVIVADYEGTFPFDVETLQQLPGIGRYTAGAIASFAFEQRAPIVEANTRRLYCRLLGYANDPRSSGGQQALWLFAEKILPKKRPGGFNQALMELGATVCSPKKPDCEKCPVQTHCRAFSEGTQNVIPSPLIRPHVTEMTEVCVAVRRKNRFLLRRRADGERWAGLWDFVRFAVDEQFTLSSVIQAVQEQTGLNVELGHQIAELKHSVTRYRIRLKCYTAEAISGRLQAATQWHEVSAAKFCEYPLSVTGRKLAKLLAETFAG